MKRSFRRTPVLSSRYEDTSYREARMMAKQIIDAMHQLESALEYADGYPVADRFYEETGIDLEEFQEAYRTLKQEWS